jgi:hypothetical protein
MSRKYMRKFPDQHGLGVRQTSNLIKHINGKIINQKKNDFYE